MARHYFFLLQHWTLKFCLRHLRLIILEYNNFPAKDVAINKSVILTGAFSYYVYHCLNSHARGKDVQENIFCLNENCWFRVVI